MLCVFSLFVGKAGYQESICVKDHVLNIPFDIPNKAHYIATVFKGFLMCVTPVCVCGPAPGGITSPYSSSVTLSATGAVVSAAWSIEVSLLW